MFGDPSVNCEGTTERREELEAEIGEAVGQALQTLAIGFVEHPDNDLDPHDPEDRQAVHGGAMKLLYRLLFVLRAEAVGRLPLDNRVYWEQHSLHRLKQAIGERIDTDDVFLDETTDYYGYLSQLFRLVDGGSDAFYGCADPMEISPYPGGLFQRADPVTGEPGFLTEYVVGDADVAKAVDLLARGTGGDGRSASSPPPGTRPG